jgi:nucleotide-binding universal stress UspA family protein
MMAAGDETKSERIVVVAFDTSARGQAALEAAVWLAAATRAQLQGLFVEDEDLLRLAALPFAREIDCLSASLRQLQAVTMERALRAAADEAQRSFSNTLQQMNLQWTFRVVRGNVAQATLAAAGDVDLLIIGQQGRSLRQIATRPTRRPRRAGAAIVAVVDHAPSAERTLELAASLAKQNSQPLCVLALIRQGEQLSERWVSWLQRRQIQVQIHQVIEPERNAIVDFASKQDPSMLLINRDCGFLDSAQIARLVNECDCPLVLT